MMHIKSTFMVALLIGLVSCQSINTVVSSGSNSYALDGFPFLSGPDGFTPHAYEVSNGAITATYNLSGSTGTHTASAFVSGNTLFQYSGAYGIAFLSSYALPFTSNPAVPLQQLQFASHLMIPAIIDTTDNIALAMVTRNLNLVDLSSFTITSTYTAIVGSRKSAGALVYNHDTNRAYFFISAYCYWGNCQHIQEYDISASLLLTQLAESFAPDYNTAFNTGSATGCELDYSTNSIWCLNAEASSLVQFSVANLNSNSIVSLTAGDYTDDNVAFDFVNQKAYVTSDSVTGFSLFELSLPSGSVLRSASFSGNPVVSLSLDTTQGKLFVGHDNADESPEMTIVDLSSATLTASVLVF